MVQKIKEFSAKIESYTFADWEVLDEREIGVHEARSVNGRARSVPELSWGCIHKRAGVEPRRCGMNLGRSHACWVSRDRTGLVRVAANPTCVAPSQIHTT